MSAAGETAGAEASCGIRWEGVGLTYPGPPPVEALRPAHLVIEPGAYLAVTGPSGSGKSTMLNVLGLLDRPTTGRYLLDGVDVAGLPGAAQASLRSCWFGFVFQRFHLLPALTAAENVELGLMYAGVRRQARQHRAREVLARVGLGARFDHRPGALSAGEQQRVAIARAIVRDQRFILADEPTGNLDSRNAAAVLELLESFVDEGIGVVSITHDEAIAARASRRLRLLDGAIVDGAP